MSDAVVTVAIPVRNGAAVLDRTLQAVRAQRLDADRAIELLVCDSGSRDGSVGGIAPPLRGRSCLRSRPRRSRTGVRATF